MTIAKSAALAWMLAIIAIPGQAANRNPRMGALYTRLLRDWTEAGGGLFMHLENCEGYGANGSWGALEYISQPRGQAPKFDALQRFIEGK